MQMSRSWSTLGFNVFVSTAVAPSMCTAGRLLSSSITGGRNLHVTVVGTRKAPSCRKQLNSPECTFSIPCSSLWDGLCIIKTLILKISGCLLCRGPFFTTILKIYSFYKGLKPDAPLLESFCHFSSPEHYVGTNAVQLPWLCEGKKLHQARVSCLALVSVFQCQRDFFTLVIQRKLDERKSINNSRSMLPFRYRPLISHFPQGYFL